MILDLKSVFLGEKTQLTLQDEVDLSEDNRGSEGFASPVAADITVINRAGLVEMTAKVSFDYRFACDRCAVMTNRRYAYQFRHILVAKLSEESGDDYIEAPDYKLDTDALIRDDILLELPSKLVCQESCKGLCSKCGKNLNEGSCTCNRQETDPRLAVLKQLLAEE